MKRPAFQFYPADWSGSRWVVFDVSTALLPRKPACYVIYLDGALSYVGQASDLASRISNHGIRQSYGRSIITKWGNFASVVIKARFGDRLGDWAAREIRLISRLQPPLNCVGGQKRRRTL
jgi:excinuclease UvrABC nuclease subunit